MIEENKNWYLENEDDFQDLPDLEERYESDSESEDDYDDEESVTETHLLQNKLKRNKTKLKQHSSQGNCSILPRR